MRLLRVSYRGRNRLRFTVWTFMSLATVAAVCCGCVTRNGVTKTTITPQTAKPVAKDATRAELIERYNAVAHGVQTLNATLELKPIAGSKYSGVIQEYHEVKAFLLAARPADIRVIGQVPVIGKTAFDMASDGETFRVSIPSKNKFLVGALSMQRASDKPIENLRPDHLLEAFLWPEIRKEEEVLFEEFNSETGRYYVLTVLRGGYRTEILRKIWFDRADLQVARIENFAPKGVLLADIHFSDWQPEDVHASAMGAALASATAGVTTFARSIEIERPHDDYRMGLQASKITLNEQIPTDRFQLAQPQGSELVHVGEEHHDQKPAQSSPSGKDPKS